MGMTMQLNLNKAIASAYRSRSQIARIVTEDWALRNMYCVACDSDALRPFPTNTKAVDFDCPRCNACFQLKSSSTWNQRRIAGAGYDAMTRAVSSARAPHLLVLQYTDNWMVHNLLLVPSFFLTSSVIERRTALSPRARRAGWVGCNILLGAIPPEGKLLVVSSGTVHAARVVRERFARVRPFEKFTSSARGWTFDVLRAVHSLDRTTFSLGDVYACEHDLQKLHPRNRNVRPKIRQQLQVLRDLGLLRFNGRGRYEVRIVENNASE